jgi:hypothetical protein
MPASHSIDKTNPFFNLSNEYAQVRDLPREDKRRIYLKQKSGQFVTLRFDIYIIIKQKTVL